MTFQVRELYKTQAEHKGPLTIREELAALILARFAAVDDTLPMTRNQKADLALAYADTLLERSRKPQG